MPRCHSRCAARALASLGLASAVAVADPPVVGHVELLGIEQVRGEPSTEEWINSRLLSGRLRDMRECYEHALRTHPALAGAVEVDFTIAPNGRVSSVATPAWRQTSPALGSCVAPWIAVIMFPRTEGGSAEYVARFRFTRLR